MKRGIELVVFIAGAVLMALEIAGGRLLVFDYGGSVFVWGAIIAVVLSGLSLGYYLGGKLADKKPYEKILSLIILIAGLLILIIPLTYSKFVLLIEGISLMFAPLVMILLLFFLPSILLGMVSPFAIKLKVKGLEKIGKDSGNLYALATIGSVVGTFLTTFVLILLMPITMIFILLSASLMAVVLVLNKNKKFYLFCLVVLLVVFLSLSDFFSASGFVNNSDLKILNQTDGEIVFESVYGPVKVEEYIKNEKKIRGMYISNGVMGEIYVEDEFGVAPGWEYLDFMTKTSVFAKEELNAKDALILGVGAGVIATRLSKQYDMNVDAVDINGVVLDVAEKYFGLTPSKNLKLHTKDARMFLKNTPKKYDVINMDTFKYIDGTYVIPTHLTTQEFFELSKKHLTEDGIFIIMIVDFEKFFDREYATISSVFENVYAFDAGLQVLVASDKELDFPDELMEDYVGYEVSDDALVYTDDYVPISELG